MADIVKKDIRYVNRDFGQLRNALIDFAKNYYPDTYRDFNEASPGMMFIEMAAYVGDVLSFYTDTSLKESLLTEAEESANVFALAQSKGYKPKLNRPAIVELDVFQLVPSIGSGTDTRPDYTYAVSIEGGMVVGSLSNSNVEFRTTQYVDFRYSSSFDPTTVTVYETDGVSGDPTYYLLSKKVKAVSGRIESEDFTFQSPKPYDKVVISNPEIIEILDATDTDGNTWVHVPYLAQDTILQAVPNLPKNDAELSQYRDDAPYLMKLRKTARRFVSRVKSNGDIEIQFGAGVTELDDEELIPNPDNVGSSLTGIENSVSLDIDPTNFLRTSTYGLAPSNTTLTIRYTVGNGIEDNVVADDLTKILDRNITLEQTGLDPVLSRQIISSVAVNNPNPAQGAGEPDTIDEIRNNALASFASQNRAVTKEDYIIRTYSMPTQYGSIAKAYITKDDQLNSDVLSTSQVRTPNPLALNLYVAGYDGQGKVTQVSKAAKENLKTYLGYHRMLTDAVNIKDAYIINIGVDFEVIPLPQYNSNEVLLRCINKMKQVFDISRWQINQPIVLSNLYTELDRVEGVQTVTSVQIKNLYDTTSGYSGNIYDINEATVNGIVYPSLDPSIFEVKYPNKDISGRVRAF